MWTCDFRWHAKTGNEINWKESIAISSNNDGKNKNESEIHCFELQRFIETRKQIEGSLTSSGIFVYCSINGIIYIPRVVSSQPGRLQPFLGYYFQSLASSYAFLS